MHDQSHDSRDEGMSMAEAARALGITESAVLVRVQRGKLAAEHTRDGRLLVYLERDTVIRGRTRGSRDTGASDERYARSLEEQVGYLRAQLEHVRGQLKREQEARTEERRRQDAVKAQLAQANEEQARTIRELEAPAKPQPSEREADETVEEAPERAEPRSATGETQEGARRPWWRRVLGR
jgi:hypothetical protein